MLSNVPLDENSSNGLIELSQTESRTVHSLPVHPTWRAHKTIFDRVHDQMLFHPALVRIIDTPEFQRLRELHQLGNARFVFPSATHTRFEHCLGVAHLATRMLRSLAFNHEMTGPHLGLTEADVLCVSIAGLCHDLGHGPLSHVFEHYVKEMRARRKDERRWSHEQQGVVLFRRILETVDLSEFGFTAQDTRFVELLIVGLSPRDPWPGESTIGRDEKKRFLFDIVCNKRNGIDVDKLDYFLRDSMSCYGKLPEICVERIFSCARVIECDGQTQICYEEKVGLSLGDLFMLRAKLHKYVYQHRVVLVLDTMVMDAFRAAELGGWQISDGTTSCALSETVDHPSLFVRTGDWIINVLEFSTDPCLAKCREILQRVRNRDLYHAVGEYERPQMQPSVSRDEIYDELSDDDKQLVEKSDIAIVKADITYGSSDTHGDPLIHVRFFNPKVDPNKAIRIGNRRLCPLFSPKEYAESTVWICCKSHQAAPALKQAMESWFARALGVGKAKPPKAFINSTPPPTSKRPRSPTSALGPKPPLHDFTVGQEEPS